MIKAIGIGNRFMTDDGIAIAVMESLRNKLEAMGIEVIIGETDFQFCFHQLKDDDFVIILDALYKEASENICIYKLREAVSAYGEPNFQHDMSIFDLMRLHAKPLKGYLIGIGVAETGFGCELSEALREKFCDICLEVERIICKIVKEV